MAGNPAQDLIKFGQSVWYDNISREMLEKGELKRLIAEWGVRGLTSNPTIFDKAISSGSSYDSQINELKPKKLTPDAVFEELALKDIAAAADLLLPIYKESGGNDGIVSIEVSPLLAANTEGTVEEGLRLNKRLNRPNIMVKVPGTPEGIPAVFMLLEQGVNINITLLFSVDNYSIVANTYVDALKARVKKNLPIDNLNSVASFFVSRVDSSVDKELAAIASRHPDQAAQTKSLEGKFGIVNSQLAYRRYQQIFEGPEFAELKKKGGKAQRPLWASTGTKDPKYSDVMYVDGLIGQNTVNTMPHATLQAFVDHGKCANTIVQNMDEADRVVQQLTDLGVDLNKILMDLQIDGVKKFSESFRDLNATIAKKL